MLGNSTKLSNNAVAICINNARFYLGASLYHVTATQSVLKIYKGTCPAAANMIDHLDVASGVGTGSQPEVHMTEPVHAENDITQMVKGKLDGTVAVTNNTTTLTGTATSFLSQLSIGCEITLDFAGTRFVRRVTAIASDTSATLSSILDAATSYTSGTVYRDDRGMCAIFTGNAAAEAWVRWSI